jgi:hypothetical protein
MCRRYDKLRLLTLYTKSSSAPRRLKDLYGRLANTERAPQGHETAKRLEDEEIKRLEEALFKEKSASSFAAVIGTGAAGGAGAVAEEVDPREKIYKHVYLILNKISPTTFDKLR